MRLIGAFESPARAPVSSKMTIRGRGAAFFSRRRTRVLSALIGRRGVRKRAARRGSLKCRVVARLLPHERDVLRNAASSAAALRGEGTGHTRASVERAPSPCRRLGGGFYGRSVARSGRAADAMSGATEEDDVLLASPSGSCDGPTRAEPRDGAASASPRAGPRSPEPVPRAGHAGGRARVDRPHGDVPVPLSANVYDLTFWSLRLD